jgi:hypothetical protein
MKDSALNKFIKLSQTTPNVDWAFSCKQNLLDKAVLVLPEKKKNLFGLATWKTERFTLHVISSAPKAVSVLAGLVLVVGITNIAAEASYVPEQPLYTVKQTLEKFELMLATSPEKESEVYAKHMQKRVNEAEKIIDSKSLSADEKEKHLKTIIKSIEKNAASVSAVLSQVQVNDNGQEINNLALSISKSAEQASKALSSVMNSGGKVNEGFSQSSAAMAASKAIGATDIAQNDALMVLAKNVDGKKVNKPTEIVKLDSETKEINIAPGSIINEIVMNDLFNSRLLSLEKRINELAKRVKFEPTETMKKVLNDNQLEAEKLNNFFKRTQLIIGYTRQAVNDGKFSLAVETYNALEKETNDILETVNRMLVNGQVEFSPANVEDKDSVDKK